MNDEILEYAACDLCGCQSHKTLFSKKDTTARWLAKCAEDTRLDPEFDFPIVRCAQCAHVFVSPRLTPEINADIYARFGTSQEPKRIEKLSFATYVCRQFEALGGIGKLLDFGCGWGPYLNAAHSAGWDAVGVEVDDAKIAFLARHHLKAVQGDLLEGLFESSTFDAVIAQQVFEHLYNPIAYLEEIRRILKPGGILFISVPNFGRPEARIKKADWSMVTPIGHVRYFNRKTLRRFLADHGFTTLDKRYVPRFSEGATAKNLAFNAQVFVENFLDVSPRTLALFARKD